VYKLVALDLDDTLLRGDLTISERNERAIVSVKRMGVEVVLASGRMHRSMVPYARKLNLKGPMISYNGAMIKDLRSDTPILHIPLPPELAMEIVRFAEKEGLHLNYYLDDKLYVARETEWGKLYAYRSSVTMIPVGSLRIFDGMSPTKLVIISDPSLIDEILPDMEARYKGRLYVTKSKPEYLEFMNPKASKGSALKAIVEMMGIRREDIIAFGDSYNDIEMIEYAGMGVAMKNSPIEVKKAAKLIAPSAEVDGVGEVLREVFGIPL
jgi:Cof subfamily protein (haloacid dehalogenase superfamily)